MNYKEKLIQIDELQERIKAFGKLSDDVLKKINYKFRLEWNYHSNIMEGSSLTKSETRSVMVGNITVEGKPIKDILEMKGHDEAITAILKMGKGELNISEKRIKEIHKGIVHEEDPVKKAMIGQWKKDPNYLYNYKDERFDFTAPAEVPDAMHQLINWLNAEKEKIQKQSKDAMHPVMLAIEFHLRYITIHPFHDGNGRTARIFTNIILISYGYPPIYIKDTEKGPYYQYLADIQGYGGAPDLFYDFIAGLVIRSQQLVLDAIEGKEIEEEDDWEKRLRLLEKKAKSINEEGDTRRSIEIVENLLKTSIHPLLDNLVEKLNKMEKLFDKVRLDCRINGDKNYYDDYRQFKESSIFALKPPNQGLRTLFLEFSFMGFKPDMVSNYGLSRMIEFEFETYRYGIITSSKFKKHWPYQHRLTEKETKEIVSHILNEIAEEVEIKLNSIVKK